MNMNDENNQCNQPAAYSIFNVKSIHPHPIIKSSILRIILIPTKTSWCDRMTQLPLHWEWNSSFYVVFFSLYYLFIIFSDLRRNWFHRGPLTPHSSLICLNLKQKKKKIQAINVISDITGCDASSLCSPDHYAAKPFFNEDGNTPQPNAAD